MDNRIDDDRRAIDEKSQVRFPININGLIDIICYRLKSIINFIGWLGRNVGMGYLWVKPYCVTNPMILYLAGLDDQPRPQDLLLVKHGGRRNPWPRLLKWR